MGNEMGNTNTSGLRDEDNATVEGLEEKSREGIDKGKVENQRVVADEVNCLESDEAEKEISNGAEQEENGIHSPPESLEDTIKPAKVNGESGEVKPTSLSEEARKMDFKLKENLLQNEAEEEEEEEEEEERTKNSNFDTTLISYITVPEETVILKSDQHDGLDETHTETTVCDESPQERTNALKLSFEPDIDVNSHLLHTEKLWNNLDGVVITDATPDMEKTNLNTNNSPDLKPEPVLLTNSWESEVEEECVIMTEEVLLRQQEILSASEKDVHDGPPFQTELVEASSTDKPIGFQTESTVIGTERSDHGSSHLIKAYEVDNFMEFEKDMEVDYQADPGITNEIESSQEHDNNSEGEASEIHETCTDQTSLTEKESKRDSQELAEKKIEDSGKMTETIDVHEEALVSFQTVENKNEAISELKQENPAGGFYVANVKPEVSVSKVNPGNVKPDQDRPQHVQTNSMTSTQPEQQEYIGRQSAESNSDNLSSHNVIMRKSPSFDLDLHLESDQTPLLHQDKAASEEADVSFGNPVVLGGYVEGFMEDQMDSVEKKVVSSDEKLKTQFKEFLKEDREDLNADDEEASTSEEIKGRRKSRSFLLGNCMCCATVLN